MILQHLITFWLSLSSTEFDKSSPLCSSSAGDFLAFIWSISAGLPSNSVSSEPLEKSIGACVSSSNIPKETKTEYCVGYWCYWCCLSLHLASVWRTVVRGEAGPCWQCDSRVTTDWSKTQCGDCWSWLVVRPGPTRALTSSPAGPGGQPGPSHCQS